MVRLRLHDPAHALELVDFLRRCECSVRQLGPATLGVTVGHPIALDSAVRRLGTGLCYRCGERIEQALFRLGSPRCHDCRHESGTERMYSNTLHEDWARMEVEAYVKVWRALNEGAQVEVLA